MTVHASLLGTCSRITRMPCRSSTRSCGCRGEAAGFDMKIHPHMLRHACGFKLANDGIDTRTIQANLGQSGY